MFVSILTGIFAWLPLFSALSGTLISSVFLLGGMLGASWLGLSNREAGLFFAPVSKVFLPGILAAVIIFPPYIGGYILWSTFNHHNIKVPSSPLSLYPQGLYYSSPQSTGWMIGNTLFIRKFVPDRVKVLPLPEGCSKGLVITRPTKVQLHECEGFSISAQVPVVIGDSRPARRAIYKRSLWNLLYLFFVELIAIALPEELFYRGVLQEALKGSGKRIRVFGAEIGWEVPLVSALFALGHLITIPAAFRLAVFFPSLVFGYLRARTKSIGSSVFFHALSNVLLYVIQGFVVF